ncbi:unnamed protein product, partial [Mesorhabditis spiculigera]
MLWESMRNITLPEYEAPTTYTRALNISVMLSTPFNLFVMFVILRAPGQMIQGYRYFIFALQLETLIFELFLELSIPELYYPLQGIAPHGVIKDLITTYPRVAWFITLFMLSIFWLTVLLLHLYRYQLMRVNKMRKGIYYFCMVMGILLWAAYMVINFFVWRGVIVTQVTPEGLPDVNEYIYRAYIKTYPGVAPFVRTIPPTAFSSSREPFDLWLAKVEPLASCHILTACYTFGFGSAIILLVALTCLEISKHALVSVQTRRSQRNLTLILFAQITIPFMCVIFPMVSMAVSLLEESWMPQWWTNFLLFCVAQHGFVSSIGILLCYTPHRTYVKSLSKTWFPCCRGSPEAIAIGSEFLSTTMNQETARDAAGQQRAQEEAVRDDDAQGN